MSISLSVCIPIYGVEKYIERCAHSLFSQTLQDGIEFIFVNDYSPDLSIKLLENVLSQYPDRVSQVKIINHHCNKGVSASRQAALDNASGDYVIFCDSDDWIEPSMYETLLTVAKDRHADVVGCDFIIENVATRKKVELNYSDKAAFIRDVIGNKWGTVWKFITKRSLIIKYGIRFQEGINYGEDYIYTSFVLLNAHQYVHVNECLYHYNCSNELSLMHLVSIKNAEQQKLASEFVFSLIHKKGLSKDYEEEILIRKIFTRLQFLRAGGNWKYIYPEINSKLLMVKRISWIKKIILIGINLFPTRFMNHIIQYKYILK